MIKNKILVVIPARYGSTRFPGKPLAKLGGKEIIIHVCERVALTGFELAVATDDEIIATAVEKAGFKAVMTRNDHPSGTDRVNEAAEKLRKEGLEFDVVINVQGDEPFINPEDINKLACCFNDEQTSIATLIKKFPKNGAFKDLENPNKVKVEKSSKGFALTFSRSVIPYLRGEEKKDWPNKFQYYTHIGIYGYRAEVLNMLTQLCQGEIEKAESLEQLRWLDAGYRIRLAETESETIGIDTPEDLTAAEAVLKSKNNLLIL